MTTPADSAPRLAAGERVGAFVVERELGHGGMGVVYVAVQQGLDRRVALKVIAPRLAADQDFRARFVTEAHAQGALDSPHVVHVYDHGEDAAGRLYLASQLVPDGDLSRVLRRDGPLSMHSALDVLAQVADGLQTAHEAGLVHRDIKPANVLLRRTPDGLHAYLTDFGVVGVRGAGPSSQIVGTPAYQAPELASGAPATPATDVYALGCVLWAALTGRPPYSGPDELATVRAHVDQPVPTLPTGAPLRGELDAVLARALAKRPEERYPSARELRQSLLRLLPRAPRLSVAVATASSATRRPRAAGLNPPSRPSQPSQSSQPSQPSGPRGTALHAFAAPSEPEQVEPEPAAGPVRPPQRRRRWLLAGAVALVVLVAAVVLTAVVRGDDPPPPTRDPRIARAVSAIAKSFVEGDGGIYFQPGYGTCVGSQTVDATGVQALVDQKYLDPTLSKATKPTDVRTMSEGVATAWADAQVHCQDWDATADYLRQPPLGYSKSTADRYTTCMRGIGDETRRTALRKDATAENDATSVAYRLAVVACTAKLL